jgi:hypothetical protein
MVTRFEPASALTETTPGTSPTSRSMVAVQWLQLMLGTLITFSSILVSFVFRYCAFP